MSKKPSRKASKGARTTNDLETIAVGNPKKTERRAKNGLVGELLGKLRIWR